MKQPGKQAGVATHALVTGPIVGRIPVGDGHPDDFVDVTPPVLLFEHDDDESLPPAMLAVAAAIEDEHRVRGTLPEQVED
jgi:hypothetical protein